MSQQYPDLSMQASVDTTPYYSTATRDTSANGPIEAPAYAPMEPKSVMANAPGNGFSYKHNLSAGHIVANMSEAVTDESNTWPGDTHAGQTSNNTQPDKAVSYFHRGKKNRISDVAEKVTCRECVRNHYVCSADRPECARCIKLGLECVYELQKRRGPPRGYQQSWFQQREVEHNQMKLDVQTLKALVETLQETVQKLEAEVKTLQSGGTQEL